MTYQADQFLDKNKDYVVAEHQALLNSSRCPFVENLFPPLPEETSKQSKFSSIGTRFKVCHTGVIYLYLVLQWSVILYIPKYTQQQLQSLMETLSTTEPHYIRCVKPNAVLKPGIFENFNVLNQLRCGVCMHNAFNDSHVLYINYFDNCTCPWCRVFWKQFGSAVLAIQRKGHSMSLLIGLECLHQSWWTGKNDLAMRFD